MNKVIPTLTIKPNKPNKRKNIENFKQMIEPKPPIIVVKKNKARGKDLQPRKPRTKKEFLEN